MSKLVWQKAKANFKTDLLFGQKAEAAFLHATDGTLKQLDGRNGDFEVVASGTKLELKVDRYDHSKTPNFFVEKYSYGTKLGGAFRALEDGSELFAYYFQTPGIVYLFKTQEFVDRVTKIEQGFDLTDVVNLRHTTQGYTMDRSLFEDLRLNLEEYGIKFDGERYRQFEGPSKAT